MGLRSIFRNLLNPWVILSAILIALLLLAITVTLVSWSRPGPLPMEMGTAIINVIAAPTETALPVTVPPAPSPTTPVAATGELIIGDMVEVSGTGGDGLRLRFAPGLNSQIRLLGAEGEIFQLVDGPQQSDNYIWWYLENPEDRSRRGWAVVDFLVPVQSQ